MKKKTSTIEPAIMLRASDEFAVGKHGIGYVESAFTSKFGSQSFTPTKLGVFQKLGKYMENADMIERELNPGKCTLSDIYAFLENPPEGTKDGNFNLFLVEDKVVSVYWWRGGSHWYVFVWYRVEVWRDGYRVFSPGLATSSLVPTPSGSLTLEQMISEIKRAGYTVVKIV